MRQFLTLLAIIGLFAPLTAQNLWTPVPSAADRALPETAVHRVTPTQFRLFQTDYSALVAALAGAPMEFTAAAREQPLTLALPTAGGALVPFRLAESPVMAPELTAKYPAIRTYAGRATDGSGLTVRLGVGYKGFHAFIFALDGGIQTVRPYAEGALDLYMSYRMEDLPADPSFEGGRFRCGVEDTDLLPTTTLTPKPLTSPTAEERGNAPVTLKTYRAAIAAQGEYSQFHGGTIPSVLAAIVEAINFISGITERDFSTRLELIASNDQLIFLDPDTDPYSGPYVTEWNDQNVPAINNIIGLDAYDIGHVFARVSPQGGIYIAGEAALGSICTQINKARGGSSLPSPVGEGFYVIAAHEMGHQFSATHTFNSCPPAADARTGSTAFEPGGGSTIMSYAGTCDPDVVQNQQSSYYHIASIEQAASFIAQDAGNTCGTDEVTDNEPPSVSIPLTDGFYIPISTPFALTGIATDPNGDELSYCWEEYDLGIEGPLGAPVGTAPLFRSFPPKNTPTRLFPRFENLIFNTTTPSEYLPDYSRVLNFKFTVRDNHPGAGGVSSAQVQFRSTDQAGPFRVTYPNAANIDWYMGEYRTVTWDVANTDKPPVNCQTVNIVLSTNSGVAFTVVLAAGVPNNGSCCIRVPDIPGSTMRLKVEAADNIFFDLSNASLEILPPPQAGFGLCPAATAAQACAPTTFTTTVSTNGWLGFTDPITLEASGLPAGAVATFSPNPVLPGGGAIMNLDFPAGVAEGDYDLIVTGTAAGLTAEAATQLTVVSNDFSGLALQLPLDGATGVVQSPVLRWTGIVDADSYDIQVATSPSFEAATIVTEKIDHPVDTFPIPIVLEKGQAYYWRVQPKNECAGSAWTPPFAFATLVEACNVFAATGLPLSISSNGTPTVESVINVPTGGTISDVNVKKFQGSHNYFSDLDVRLIGPDGTTVLLFQSRCPQSIPAFHIGFDDIAAGVFPCPTPNNGNPYKPAGTLAAFNGKDAAGNWTLRVKDNVSTAGGQLAGFELELCSSTALNAPYLVNNNPLSLDHGLNAVIPTDLLLSQDANNGPGELTYTLITIPVHGHLEYNWGGPLAPGAQFTQTDIDNGYLRFFDYGGNTTGLDEFRFSVADGEGGFLVATFQIMPSPLGIDDVQANMNFSLAPNPANASARLRFDAVPAANTRVALVDLTGRQIRRWAVAPGAQELTLDVQGLPGGIYSVVVENAVGRVARKLVVMGN